MLLKHLQARAPTINNVKYSIDSSIPEHPEIALKYEICDKFNMRLFGFYAKITLNYRIID